MSDKIYLFNKHLKTGVIAECSTCRTGVQAFLLCVPVLVSNASLPGSPEDTTANPNKRQRQPALLGDHPPEYCE